MNCVESHDKDVILLALEVYGKRNFDFVDCILYAYHELQGVHVVTFDKKLLKLLSQTNNLATIKFQTQLNVSEGQREVINESSFPFASNSSYIVLCNDYLEEKESIINEFNVIGSKLLKQDENFKSIPQQIIIALDSYKKSIDKQINETLSYLSSYDKDTHKVPQNILDEFKHLKLKNYKTYLSDAKKYTEEQEKREQQYQSIIYRMRKDLEK